MQAKDKLKHLSVFSCAVFLNTMVPLIILHELANETNARLVENEALSSLLIISPMFCFVGGIVIAALWVCRHPELL